MERLLPSRMWFRISVGDLATFHNRTCTAISNEVSVRQIHKQSKSQCVFMVTRRIFLLHASRYIAELGSLGNIADLGLTRLNADPISTSFSPRP